jgi:tungstate transport system ATP-binding protein
VTTPLLQANGVRVRARDSTRRSGRDSIVGPCTLSVERGAAVAIYGPNGAGKTTLLQALAVLSRGTVTDGEIVFDAQPINSRRSLRDFRRRTAVVFQSALLLRGTVIDNVALGLKLRGVDAAERERAARPWLERMGIAALAARDVRGLSGGEAQRVSLARAFVLEPELIFLDEPFSSLDAPTRAALVDDLALLFRERGTTALFVSHDPAEVRRLCQRCIVLDSGSIVQQGTISEVFDRPRSKRVAAIVGVENILTARVVRQEATHDVQVDCEGALLPCSDVADIAGVAGVAGIANVAVGASLCVALDPHEVDLLAGSGSDAKPAAALAGVVAAVTETSRREVAVSIRLASGRHVRVVTAAAPHISLNAAVSIAPRRGALRAIESLAHSDP